MTYPKHVAFIMDGNRRWGKLNAFTNLQSYEKGKDVLESLIFSLEKKGVECVSCYTFSTENFSRSKEDIDSVMNVVSEYFVNLLNKGTNWKIIFSGNKTLLPNKLQELFSNLENKTKENKGIIVNLLIGYGSQDEIINAACKAQKEGKITKESFEKHLYSSNLPGIDMVVRTGGDKRLSNFMLYQVAYSELFFVDKLWCDFNEKDLESLLDEYSSRQRNYGK